MRLVFAELPIKVMDIVEISPLPDISDVTSLAAFKVRYELFGLVQTKAGLV